MEVADIFAYALFRNYTGCDHTVCAALFGIDHSEACRAYVSMINYMNMVLTREAEQPTREQLDRTMARGWETTYGTKKLAGIIDASEQYMCSPSCPQAYKTVFSSYKGRCTVKYLVEISPAGAGTYCSDGYPGRISDPELVRVSGYLKRAQRGDVYAADRGFEAVKHMLAALGADLIAPTFRFNGQESLTDDEARDSTMQANMRIHVERAIGRAKMFAACRKTLKIDEVDMADAVFRTCFLLGNLRSPLVKPGDEDL